MRDLALARRLSVLHPGIAVLAASLLAHIPLRGYAQAGCEPSGAEVLAPTDRVELRRANTAAWVPAKSGDWLCVGDAIQTGDYSSVSVRLPDGNVVEIGENALLTWAEADSERSLWEILKGIIHVISRDPRQLRFTTPFANAGLRGTEFLVEVSEAETEISVIEGVVVMTAAGSAQEVEVSAGELGVARAGADISKASLGDLRSALAWTMYFRSVFGGDLPAPDQAPPPGREADAEFFARRAMQRLMRGRVDAARDDLVQGYSLDPANASVDAVNQLVVERFGSAADSGGAGTRADASEAGARAIANYFGQAAGADLESARAGLEASLAADADNAFDWVRLSGIQLLRGDVDAALAAADQALSREPELSYAHTLRGFALHAAQQFDAAKRAFTRAVALDESDPLPRTGLGLVELREGDRQLGREHLELAVLQSPDDSWLRTFMAKVYADADRPEVASSQLQLSRVFNDEDPTPWLYEAILLQTRNQPVAALQSLERAAELNGDQPVFRSQFSLDDDLAVRSAGYGQVYLDLGFERLALVSGWESTAAAAADFSGHRLLADILSSQPRHQIARTDELWQSQLLQPMSATAIPPQFAEPNMFILDSVGPSELAFNDYNRLIAGNHWALDGAAVTGSNDSLGEYLTFSGIQGRSSYSVGHFEFDSDGLRDNNDISIRVSNAQLQFRPNAKTTWLGEIRSSDKESGDLQLLFDPENYIPNLRQTDSVDLIRLGVHRVQSEQLDVLAALHYQEGNSAFDIGPLFNFDDRFDSVAADVQTILHLERSELISGVNVMSEDTRSLTASAVPVPDPPFVIEQQESSYLNTGFSSVYAYNRMQLAPRFRLTLGGSLDQIDGRTTDKRRLSPKLGMTWQSMNGFVVRAAMFRTLQGPLVSKQHIQPRLEPTHVAGFNQVYFGAEGDEASRFGVGIDHRLSSSLYYGVELSRRNIESGALAVSPGGSPEFIPVETDEAEARIYAYWTASDSLALSAEWQADIFNNNGTEFHDGFVRLDTRRLPLKLRYFHESGFSAGLTLTYVEQSGQFGREAFGPSGPETVLYHDQDRFSVVDASVEYRLGDRRGMLGLYVRNLFDKEFKFQDIDPENPRIMPERYISLRIALAFVR